MGVPLGVIRTIFSGFGINSSKSNQALGCIYYIINIIYAPKINRTRLGTHISYIADVIWGPKVKEFV